MKHALHTDVAILGTGIASTMIGAILARAGLDVLLIDKGTHPRFAIGESIVPDTSARMRLIADLYGVPEIAHLGSFYEVLNHIGPGSGVKRGLSCFSHRPGQGVDPEASVQLPSLTAPFGPDVHYYRQDTDAYMLAAAMSHGAQVRQGVAAEDLQFDADGVSFTLGTTPHRARFLIDGAGFRSPVAEQLGLREAGGGYQTRSRSIFTHMIGVEHFDLQVDRKAHGLPYALSQTTLHHMFEGGWFWVIPFDNHTHATNRLCSVGLTLDCTKYPKTNTPPEAEFLQFVAQYPSVARQFSRARAVRPWIGTGRIQYGSKHLVGDRWALLPHAAGFVDPLFSAGLTLTCVGVAKLAEQVLAAFADRTFSRDQFLPYETTVQQNLQNHDRFVANAYTAFSNGFDLWNAWFRVWASSSVLGTLAMVRLQTRYHETQNRHYLQAMNSPGYSTMFGQAIDGFRDLVQETGGYVEAVGAGTLSATEARDEIFNALGQSQVVPRLLHLGDPARRHVATFSALTSWRVPKSFKMGYTGPPEMTARFADFRVRTVVMEAVQMWAKTVFSSKMAGGAILRDSFLTWNPSAIQKPRPMAEPQPPVPAEAPTPSPTALPV